jgi:rhodanese-related sulfurtransferase
MQNITPSALAAWLNDPARSAPQLVDVREPWEYELGHIAGSQLHPLAQLPASWQALTEAQPIVCICHHGMRSLQAAMFIEHQGFTEVYNLQGGVHAWANQVDPAFPQY